MDSSRNNNNLDLSKYLTQLPANQIIKTIRQEFDTTDQLYKELRKRGIKLSDLEPKSPNDKTDIKELKRVQEVREQYYEKKKKFNLSKLQNLIHEKHKKRQSKSLLQSVQLEDQNNISQDYKQDTISESNQGIQQRTFSKSPFNHKNSIFSLTGSQNDPNIDRNSMNKTENKQKTTERSMYASLVVHKNPDIPLKVDLTYRDPSLSLEKKIKNHERVDNIKNNLEKQTELDRQKYLEKLKKIYEREKKVKESIEYEDYVRKSKIEKHSQKLSQVIQIKDKQRKDHENKSFSQYKEHVTNLKKLQEQEEKERKTELKEFQEQLEARTQQDSPQLMNTQKRNLDDFSKSLSHQISLNEKLSKGNQRFQQKISEIIKSRNDYQQKLSEMRSKYQEYMREQNLLSLKKDYEKVNLQETKIKRVNEEKQQYKELLQQHNQERFNKKSQLQKELQKQKERWNNSITSKHKKQQFQVELRDQALKEEIEAMKEYKRLKREDLMQNLNLTMQEQSQKRNNIYNKHQSLDQRIKLYRHKYDIVQENSRVLEIRKKLQLQEQSQSIKLTNPLIEMRMSRDLSQNQFNHQTKLSQDLRNNTTEL